MRKQEKRTSKILNVAKEHIYKNVKQYAIVSIFFLIGIIAGVIFVNYAQIETKQQIESYITTFIDCLKTDYQIDYINLLKNIIGNHIVFAFTLWFMGCTIIGIPVVYALITYKGFSLGYTISTIIFTLGTGKGILFSIITLLLQNLITIPAILALAVSGMKLYQSMMKDKRKENIKIEMMRHTIFSLFILLLLMVSSIIEVYGSNGILSLCISYF